MDFYSYLNGIYPILMVLDGFGWFWLLLGGFEIPHIVFCRKIEGPVWYMVAKSCTTKRMVETPTK